MINTISILKMLMDLSGEWIDKVRQRKPPKQMILELDSSVSETYGQQVGSAYKGGLREQLLSWVASSV